MTLRAVQWSIASVFLLLGGWCLLAPSSVLELTITPAWRSDDPIVPVLVGAFGAQAMLAGLLAACARFERVTFLVLGLAMLPFFAFDYWFHVVEPMLTPVGLLDVAGNLAMLGLCVVGWRIAGRTRPA